MTKLNITFFLIIVGISFSLVYLSQGKKEDTRVNTKEGLVNENLIDNPEKQFEKLVNYIDLRIKRRPSDISNYNELAGLYLQKARETGDLKYYIKAESILKKSLELNSENYLANLYMGLIKQAKHEFRSSIQYVKKSVKLIPEESFAYGVLGDAYLELGNLTRSKDMYEKMHRIKPSLESFGRLSNLNALQGNVDGALVEMEKAYEAGIKDSNSIENLAWTQAMIGSIYFDAEDFDQAEVYYKKSLKIMDNYYLALQKLAELNVKKENYDEAIRLYNKVLEINSRPDIHHSLSHLYKETGKILLANEHDEKAKKLKQEYEKLGFKNLHTHSNSHSH